MNLLEKIGGRKAAACLTGVLAIVGLYIYKGPLDPNVLDGIKFLVTTYLAGNIGADAVAAIASRSAAPEAIQSPSTEPDPRIDALLQAQSTTNQGMKFIIDKIQQQG